MFMLLFCFILLMVLIYLEYILQIELISLCCVICDIGFIYCFYMLICFVLVDVISDCYC